MMTDRSFSIVMAILIVGFVAVSEAIGFDVNTKAKVTSQFVAVAAMFYLLYEAVRAAYLAIKSILPKSVNTKRSTVRRQTDYLRPSPQMRAIGELSLANLVFNFVHQRMKSGQTGYTHRSHSVWIQSKTGAHSHMTGAEHDFTPEQIEGFLTEAKALQAAFRKNPEIQLLIQQIESTGATVNEKLYAHKREMSFEFEVTASDAQIDALERLAATKAGHTSFFPQKLAAMRLRLMLHRLYSRNTKLWQIALPVEPSNPYGIN